MATLNLSTNGPSISNSYQSVVNAPAPVGNAAQSSTYGQWAVFSVSAPLANAFQQDTGGKESVLKVQSTGGNYYATIHCAKEADKVLEGELVDLIDEFSDGRVQFAFAKIKDPNTTLPKSVLIGWCGEGVPERTKGYFTSHLAAVSKVLHGYHLQVTARSDRDLTPESIIKKVSDASGSKYSGAVPPAAAGPPPPISSKPAFTPTKSSGAGKEFNPLAASRVRTSVPRDTDVDEDGWGQDAPPVTRTQLEKVQSSYQPTKVNIREISSQAPEASRFRESTNDNNASGDSHVVKGGYQPVGKVDIAALRRQAQEKPDDRPVAVKGSYEPVGKVDIAAIRARTQQPSVAASSSSANKSPGRFPSSNPSRDQQEEEEERSLPDRAAPSSASERLTSLPKPKVASRFGVGTGSFAGTKAPTPAAFGLDPKSTTPAPPIGVGRTFADQGGKTPAQLWAEKKARERGLSGASDNPSSTTLESQAPVASQSSGEWKSGYGGRSWAPVQTTRTGQSASSLDQQRTGQEEDVVADEAVLSSPNTGVGARRDRFQDAAHTGATDVGSRATSSPPPLDTSSKPNAGRGMPMPGLPVKSHQPQSQDEDVARLPTPPAQPPRSPTPPTPPAMDSGSPIRVAMPIGRGKNEVEVEDAHEEQFSPPQSMPTRSLAQVVPHEDDLTEEPVGHEPARGAGEATAAASFGQLAAGSARSGAQDIKRALVQYDYEKAEDNELELREGEYVTNIEMVDEDWWMGENSRGESGLFPSNYVELVGTDLAANGDDGSSHQAELDFKAEPQLEPESTYNERTETQKGTTATALYDYEAAEGNELSFPENAKITGVEFPDEDWWSGEYRGQHGLFPANYVQLDE